MDLVTLRTADDLVKLYKKELLKACSGTDRPNASIPVGDTNGGKTDNTGHNSDEATYRYALVHTIYDISIRFPATLGNIIPTICDVSSFLRQMPSSHRFYLSAIFVRKM